MEPVKVKVMGIGVSLDWLIKLLMQLLRQVLDQVVPGESLTRDLKKAVRTLYYLADEWGEEFVASTPPISTIRRSMRSWEPARTQPTRGASFYPLRRRCNLATCSPQNAAAEPSRVPLLKNIPPYRQFAVIPGEKPLKKANYFCVNQ